MSFPDFSAYGYQVIEELGQNTQGGRVAYRAQDSLGTQVVIKQFQFARSGQNWSGFKAIEREIQVLKGLEHKGIPAYIESFETDNGFCLVTKYIKSQTLAVMRSFGADQIKQITVQLLEILVYLQQRIPPIIHRDIKPENILVDDDLNVYLIDFGFARVGGGEVNMSSVTSGSFGFMAPEQLRNINLDKSSDLYSLGMTLICLLGNISSMRIGEYIDSRNQLDRKKFIQKLSDYSLGIINWLTKLVEPEPKDRFSNAVRALEAFKPLSVIRTDDTKSVKYCDDFDPNTIKLQSKKSSITPSGRLSMRQFPTTLIPPEVQRIAQSKPVAPKFDVKLPSFAYSQPTPINIQEAIGLSFGLIVIVGIVNFASKELGIILLVVGMVVIILRTRSQSLSYKRRYQAYEDSLQNYVVKLEAYSREEIQYQQKLAIAHAPERVLEFRHQQFKKFFAKLFTNENAIALTKSSNAIADAISDFGVMLQQYVSGTIYQGTKLYIPSINYNWLPALTYIDPALNAHIAIEISLPSESAATLTQNSLADRFLVDSGWIIIKFSQEQISQSAVECCKEFAKLLDRLSIDPTVLSNFADTPDLVPIKR